MAKPYLMRFGLVVALGLGVSMMPGWHDQAFAQDPFSNFFKALGGQQQQQKPKRQQPQQQQNDPFGQMMKGLFGGGGSNNGSGGGSGGGAKTVAPGTGDPAAAALRQLNIGKQIQEKALKLQNSVLNVVATIKVYQAVNGALWLDIGKQIAAMNKLDEQADAMMVRKFIKATQAKRNAYRSALKSVALNPAADIMQTNQTLNANNATVSKLRQSVAVLVDSQARKGTFRHLIANQNVPLETMMKAYIGRVEDTIAAMDAAERVFKDMSREYAYAFDEMGQAIQHFEEQGGLVAAESAKQVGVLALEIARMSEIANNNNGVFGVILGVVQGVQILSDLQSLTETLNNFQETQKWFDQNSQGILTASQAARQELMMSVQTLKQIRPKLVQSWRAKIATISKVAFQERKKANTFEQEFKKSLQKAKAKAPAIAKQDMDEMQFMKRKSLRS